MGDLVATISDCSVATTSVVGAATTDAIFLGDDTNSATFCNALARSPPSVVTLFAVTLFAAVGFCCFDSFTFIDLVVAAFLALVALAVDAFVALVGTAFVDLVALVLDAFVALVAAAFNALVDLDVDAFVALVGDAFVALIVFAFDCFVDLVLTNGFGCTDHNPLPSSSTFDSLLLLSDCIPSLFNIADAANNTTSEATALNQQHHHHQHQDLYHHCN